MRSTIRIGITQSDAVDIAQVPGTDVTMLRVRWGGAAIDHGELAENIELSGAIEIVMPNNLAKAVFSKFHEMASDPPLIVFPN